MAADLTYAEVLDYLADREGDDGTVTAHPTRGVGPATLIGLTVPVSIGKIGPIPGYLDDGVDGEGAARIALLGFDDRDGSLVLVPSKFRFAELSGAGATLLLVIEAGDLTGMGFTFDFDGSPPRDADGRLIDRWTKDAA